MNDFQKARIECGVHPLVAAAGQVLQKSNVRDWGALQLSSEWQQQGSTQVPLPALLALHRVLSVPESPPPADPVLSFRYYRLLGAAFRVVEAPPGERDATVAALFDTIAHLGEEVRRDG